MTLSATECALQDVLRWRDLYRQEMNCQIIHDSIHCRDGWSREFLLRIGPTVVGYGSLAISGPWKTKPALYEFHVAPPARDKLFHLFEALLAASQPAAIETQSNDPTLGVLIHAFARNVTSESILFHDRLTTHHPPPRGAVFRPATSADREQIKSQELDEDATWLLEVEGSIVASGGVLFHYNRPYGDIYMKVADAWRRGGLGSYLVQELKRICYEHGDVPAARCNLGNLSSRFTLQRAGFVPCGHILVGDVES